MPGSLKVTFIAALAGLGAASAQTTNTPVPDKSVDFCSTVQKYHLSKFYSDCSGVATMPTAAPEPAEAEPEETLDAEPQQLVRRKPTNLPKFPYHSVLGAKETAAPLSLASPEDEHHGLHHGHHPESAHPSFPHVKPTGKPDHISWPHIKPTDIVARNEEHWGPPKPHHSFPHVEPTKKPQHHSFPHVKPTAKPEHHPSHHAEPTDIEARDIDAAERLGRHHGGAKTGLPPHLHPTPTNAHVHPTDIAARDVDAAERLGRHHGGAKTGLPPHLRPTPTDAHIPHHRPTDIVARDADEAEHWRHHPHRPTGTYLPHVRPTEFPPHDWQPEGNDQGESGPHAAAGPGEDHPTMIDDGDDFIDETIPRAHPTTVQGGIWHLPTIMPFVKPTVLPVPLPTVLPVSIPSVQPSGFLTIVKE